MEELETNLKESSREVKAKTVAYISTAFGLVAGLAWNDAIKALIESLFPLAKNTLLAKFVYAVLVTVVVVLLVKKLESLFKANS